MWGLRSEIAYPACKDLTPPALMEGAKIRLDLVHMLVGALTAAAFDAADDALVEALKGQVEHLAAFEDAPRGVWTQAMDAGLRAADLDVLVGRRLKDSDRETRIGSWPPAPPETLVRSSRTPML